MNRKLKTTSTITESEVKGIKKWMSRMDGTGKKYNPAPTAIKSDVQRLEELYEDINKTYRLVSQSILREGTAKLNLSDYQEVLLEQGQYDRNPGHAAAEGIENIIDNIKRAYTYVKDSRTRKQIANTLTKINNTAELVGSGRDQRAARTYDDVSNPLPFPEVEEPEELEDIDDEMS